jgi:hypothetical protein
MRIEPSNCDHAVWLTNALRWTGNSTGSKHHFTKRPNFSAMLSSKIRSAGRGCNSVTLRNLKTATTEVPIEIHEPGNVGSLTLFGLASDCFSSL